MPLPGKAPLSPKQGWKNRSGEGLPSPNRMTFRKTRKAKKPSLSPQRRVCRCRSSTEEMVSQEAWMHTAPMS